MPKNEGQKSKKKAVTKKKTAPKKPTTKKRVAKKGYAGSGNIWTPISGGTFGGGFDPTQQEVPTPVDLLCAYEDVVFACTNRIAQGVAEAATSFKLVVATGHADSRPNSTTKALRTTDRKWIEKNHKNRVRKAVSVEEVVDHPALDLLDTPNPLYSWSKLVELTTEYMCLVGSAFIFKGRNDLGQVRELWVLPSHLVQIEPDEKTGAIAGYKFKSGTTEELHKPSDVIHIRYTADPLDPHTSFGISPLRSIWQRFSLLRQEQGSWLSVLRNMAFPSLLASPPDNETWTPQQAERIEKQLNERFRWGNQGGVWAVQDSTKVSPLSTPPKDVAALNMYEQIRESVAQAYNVPLPMLDMADTSFVTADVTRRNFQEYCLVPILNTIFETLSHDLLPARMWLAADNIVQRDEVFELQKSTALFQGGITWLNEAREEQGYDPVPDGNKFFFELMETGTPSAQTFTTSYTGGRFKRKGYKSTVPDATALVEVLKSLYARLGQDVISRLKHANAIHTKSFFPVADWKDEIVRELVPVLRLYVEEGGSAVLGEIGGALKVLPVNKLDDAVQRAALAFADSTLSTTTLSVEDAVKATREAIQSGLGQGEANAELSKRVGAIFEDLTETRAMLIAETESSRAKHAGELLAIDESGVTAMKKWLPDNMACDLCRELARKGGVPLDQPFATKGIGPYARIDHPPGHPGCRCSLQYEFE
ncbi:phage portal protein [Gemmata obscuriglobus]|nr:phage portal protein [Gemmata obscuriglobus]